MKDQTKLQSLMLMFSTFIAIELASFLTIDNKLASGIVSVVLVLIIAGLAWKKLAYGIYALVAELILGGKGYLFLLTIGGTRLSLRIFIFAAVMIIWLIKFLPEKNKFIYLRQLFGLLWWPYIALLGAVVYGIIMSIVRGIGVNAIFLDANAFGYLFLAPVFLEGLKLKENKPSKIFPWQNLSGPLQIWLAASFWLAIKTIILFVLFSYFGRETLDYLYRWVRNSGVGEITWLPGARVFLYSQIFIVAAWLYALFGNLNEKIKKVAPILILFGGAILISLSRSFFVGMIGSIILGCVYLIWQKRLNNFSAEANQSSAGKIIVVRLVVSLFGSYLLVLLLSGALFSPQNRLIADPGASSRRNQLPILLEAIIKNPFGYGFGQTLTYETTDPRALAIYPSGQYGTYSFELGWLDFCFKVGLLGLVAYLWFLWVIIAQIWPKIELIVPILALIAIHAFTPYLNHPLGIGLLLFLYVSSLTGSEKNDYIR